MNGRGARAWRLALVPTLAAGLGPAASLPAAGSPTDPCSAVALAGHAGPRVKIVRAGVPVPRPGRLVRGDGIQIARGGELFVSLLGNGYLLRGARATLDCASLHIGHGRAGARRLVLFLESGTMRVHAAASTAAVITPEALTLAPRGTRAVVRRARASQTEATTRNQPIVLAGLRLQRLRLTVRPTQTGLAGRSGLRLDTYPFEISAAQRAPRGSDGLVPFWDDGLACSVGCRAPDAIAGWPLKPFHRQHPLRAGLNELRPSGLHVGFDIQDHDGQQVYAMSSGVVHVLAASGPDERVQVGQFVYWHIAREVREGDFARAYVTPLGRTKAGFGHLHLSEIVSATYLNPLRPGGRVLTPWSDTEAPVIGPPQIGSDGSAVVAAFDPQSFVALTTYETPVLAPAALAWRLFDAGGRSLTPLEWALRGTRHLPDGQASALFAPGATNPGFSCFALRRRCVPTWRYRLAGGLTPPLPLASLAPGHYRLSVYAWDWAGNVAARDASFRLPLSARSRGARAVPAPGAPRPLPDVQ